MVETSRYNARENVASVPRLVPCGPFSPVRRIDLYRAPAIGFYPAAQNAATGKDDRMRPIKVDDSHF